VNSPLLGLGAFLGAGLIVAAMNVVQAKWEMDFDELTSWVLVGLICAGATTVWLTFFDRLFGF
jgi:hypothetical protein